MKPILYAPETTNFDGNGIGFLSDTISCICTQDAGCYELEIEYPLGGVHFEDIKVSSWIKASVPPLYDVTPQLFYVVNISKPISKVITITCHHVSYMLNFIPIDASADHPFICQNVADAFEQLSRRALVDYPFHYSTNIGGTVYARTIYEPFMAMELLGGSEESISEMVDCEFSWNNFTIICKDKAGDKANVRLTYGVNITDFHQEENIAETITGVLPYWYDPGTEEVEEPEIDPSVGYVSTARAAVSVMLGTKRYGDIVAENNIVYTDTADRFPFKRVAVLDLSSEIEAHEVTTSVYETVKDKDGDPIPLTDDDGDPKKDKDGHVIYKTKEVTTTEWYPPYDYELAEVTEKWFKENKIGVPKVSFEVSFEELERYAEYSHLKPNRVKLYDEVEVIFKDLGVDTTAKVVKIVYDVLLEKYQKISIGDDDESTGLESRIADASTVEKKTQDALQQASLKALYYSQKSKDYAYNLAEFNAKYGEKVQDILNAVDNSSANIMTARIAAVEEDVAEEVSDREAAITSAIATSKQNTYNMITGASGGYARFYYDQGSDVARGLIISQGYNQNTGKPIGNCIVINHQGIGFSTDGGANPTSAWGIDGTFNANYLYGKTITSVTLESAHINTGTLGANVVCSAKIEGSYIKGAIIEAGIGLRFNYTNSDNTTGTIDVGVGSIKTHLTANDQITWYGQIFQGSHKSDSTASWTVNGVKKDGILFDSATFAVTTNELAIGSSYKMSSGPYNGYYNRAGITTGNIDQAGSERVIMMAAHGPNNQQFSRVACIGTTLELNAQGDSRNIHIILGGSNATFTKMKHVYSLDDDDIVLVAESGNI